MKYVVYDSKKESEQEVGLALRPTEGKGEGFDLVLVDSKTGVKLPAGLVIQIQIVDGKIQIAPWRYPIEEFVHINYSSELPQTKITTSCAH